MITLFSTNIELWSDPAKHVFVGIDIDNAANKAELKKLILNKLPDHVETTAA